MWSARSGVFFSVRPQLRVISPCLGYRGRFGFVRPLAEYPVAQFTDLFDSLGFSFMGRAALSYQSIDQIGDLDQTLAHMRLVRVALVQASEFLFRFLRLQFTVHELL